jgi:hypothetical protein
LVITSDESTRGCGGKKTLLGSVTELNKENDERGRQELLLNHRSKGTLKLNKRGSLSKKIIPDNLAMMSRDDKLQKETSSKNDLNNTTVSKRASSNFRPHVTNND